MWDPHVGLGTVPHQQIGYLWPAGPWYWVFEQLGAPDWVAQRLWLGTIMVAAGGGVLFLGRTWRWRPTSATAAALLYARSEKRRGGEEWCSKWSSRWSPLH